MSLLVWPPSSPHSDHIAGISTAISLSLNEHHLSWRSPGQSQFGLLWDLIQLAMLGVEPHLIVEPKGR